MHLFCCYTPAHEVLYREVFAVSVPPGYAIHATLINEDGSGDFLSPEFLRCIRRKVALVEDSLASQPEQILVWSDVDIRFANLPPSRLAADFMTAGTDILFQRESPRLTDVNTGFFVCRANTEVRSFFARVRESLENNPAINEQLAVNRLLFGATGAGLPRWGYLPPSYYARTHGWPPPRNLALYHANYTKGRDAVEQKMEQFRELQKITEGGWPARLWSVARRIPAKLRAPSAGVWSNSRLNAAAQ